MTCAFTYRIAGRTPYLTAITKKHGEVLEIRVNDADGATVRVGEACAKIENGVGRVKFSALREGVFTPEIIFNDKSVFLYPIRYALGEVSLAEVGGICASLGAAVYSLQCRVGALEDEIKRLDRKSVV